VEAPYEGAKIGLVLAEAYRAEGDLEAATHELITTRATFERLGALLDADRAAQQLDRLGSPAPSKTVRTFLFSDVVGSTALLEAIGDDAWDGLRRWHDQTLRGCFERHGGEEIDHPGDGFFVAFADPASAVACAVEIQRRLAEHRRDHGFAPQVRIGVHAAEALRDQGDYTGLGVHTAARIGAAAGPSEIVASADTVAHLEDVTTSGSSPVELKGLAEPVRVVRIDWRA
jgi:class 3 adenylate cyclase